MRQCDQIFNFWEVPTSDDVNFFPLTLPSTIRHISIFILLRTNIQIFKSLAHLVRCAPTSFSQNTIYSRFQSINHFFLFFFGAGSYRPDRDLKFFIGVQIFMMIDQKAMGNINMHRKRGALNLPPIFQHKVDNWE